MSPTEIADLNVPMMSAALVRRSCPTPFVRLFRAGASGRTRRPHRRNCRIHQRADTAPAVADVGWAAARNSQRDTTVVTADMDRETAISEPARIRSQSKCRRAPDEHVQPYRTRRDGPVLHKLRTRFGRWVGGQLHQLAEAAPLMPVEDRAADTWEPLVAIVDAAGGHWPDTARTATLALTGADITPVQVSLKVRLLMDCRTVFGDAAGLPTGTLLDRLRGDDEAPRAGLGQGSANCRRSGPDAARVWHRLGQPPVARRLPNQGLSGRGPRGLLGPLLPANRWGLPAVPNRPAVP
jgi:hypothetical protein